MLTDENHSKEKGKACVREKQKNKFVGGASDTKNTSLTKK